MVALHVVEGGFSDGEDVGGHFQAIAATVRVEDGVCVDAKITEGVDADQDMSNVRL